MKGLYIHIPFCKTICNYCDFPKKIIFNDEQVRNYLNHLYEELNSYKAYYKDIDTIYIGGGTPNNLNDYYLEELLSFIFKLNINYKEYTIECNPELITDNQARLFSEYGINRVSLGVQSFNERLLKLLGRNHNYTDVINSINLLHNYNITNVNIDLMFGIFSQSYDEFLEDYNKYLSLKVPHLSYYSLILEPNTRLYLKYKEDDFNDDEIVKMYNYLIDNSIIDGYKQYEISNFAKEGYESIHNLKYWNKDEYIGVGMGATSYLSHTRSTNSILINNYLKDKDIVKEDLNELDEKNEYMMLGLRKLAGVSYSDYYNKFKSNIDDDYDLLRLFNLGLLEKDRDNIRLTKKGLVYGNLVFEEFV